MPKACIFNKLQKFAHKYINLFAKPYSTVDGGNFDKFDANEWPVFCHTYPSNLFSVILDYSKLVKILLVKLAPNFRGRFPFVNKFSSMAI